MNDMAQFQFNILIEAETAEEAGQSAQYVQGVLNKVNNKKLTKLLVAAYNKPSIVDKALMALKIM
jgi:hypothetical protein